MPARQQGASTLDPHLQVGMDRRSENERVQPLSGDRIECASIQPGRGEDVTRIEGPVRGAFAPFEASEDRVGGALRAILGQEYGGPNGDDSWPIECGTEVVKDGIRPARMRWEFGDQAFERTVRQLGPSRGQRRRPRMTARCSTEQDREDHEREPEHGVHIPYRKLLVPSDLSEAATRCFPLAAKLARRFQSKILALHVPSGRDSESQADSDRLTAALGEHFEGLQIEPHIGSGTPWRAIVELARKRQVDLIAMSTQGHDSLADSLLGSTAERVVRHAPCPVLVTRAELDQHEG